MMGATFRPIGRSEKLKSSGRRIHGFLAERCQLTRIFGLGSVDRQLTRYTLSTSMIVRRNLFTLSLERNLPVISNQTESNGALVSENNEENVNDFFFFSNDNIRTFSSGFQFVRKRIRKFTKCWCMNIKYWSWRKIKKN